MRYLLFMHDIQLHSDDTQLCPAVLHLIVLSANIYKLRSCRKILRIVVRAIVDSSVPIEECFVPL